MTEEETKAIQQHVNRAADGLTEYGDDVLVMILVEHEADSEHPRRTRQMIFAGRGNWWARKGMAQDYVDRCSAGEDDPDAESD